MNKEDRVMIAYARLLGEYTGNLKGFLWWDLPHELKGKINERIKELEEIDLDKI